MAVRPILRFPDERLHTVARRVEHFDDALRQLVGDMADTMYRAPGIGLAAIQIGVPRRMLVIDLAKDGEEKKPLFVANPEVIWASESQNDYEEGCLSIPEFYEMVTRPAEIRLRYLDRQGEAREMHATGLMATCLQHEIDHLNGVLFIDHISRLKRERVIKKFQKAQKLGKL